MLRIIKKYFSTLALATFGYIFTTGFVESSGSKVIELSDRFLELRGESTWLIMFYAPWCGHCKKLEPTWNHVAQVLYGSEIRVGRVDCTRFTVMPTEFRVKGFPTIMFIRGNEHHYFSGDRTTDEIVGFGLRMSGAPVPDLEDSLLKKKFDSDILFFTFVGTREGALWDSYYSLALGFRYHHYLYATSPSSAKEILHVNEAPAVVVCKGGSVYTFSEPNEEVLSNSSKLNDSLYSWINQERFPSFVKYTHGNLGELWKLDKYLVITVLEETKIGDLKTKDEDDFRSTISEFVSRYKDKYRRTFQFGWTGTPDLANGIAMERLEIPSLIVVNTSVMEFYKLDDLATLTEEDLARFLDGIVDKTIQAQGGNSIPISLYRVYFNGKTSLEDMWHGNPVLTSVLFGLPLGFLTLICYSIWCSDILEANEEEEEGGYHEKKE